ncbi:insulinase family protein [Aldersonia sp. NBC_00410]|uniref:M16 family metallopeptidase n=1 Tax=Aldersonia sp. NBC_00410 TaxID=2975954 RepID=UPI00224E1EA4|nr:pitrilysin family protein [Aldersonia sp. NBC_00410]MCX5046375.1 insulinase family protein [Aldersonia sp. NBC_00410]
MARIDSETLDNGLPLHRIRVDGTRATTILVAFDAGARAERRDENGTAHFLEHVVFKGGQIYRDHGTINRTAEQLGASMNAATSHDLVEFHITVRAEAAPQAIDLMTDFVARPRLDEVDLGKERGVVAQEIARYLDQPAYVASRLSALASFGDHPLGRPVLGPSEHLPTFTRAALQSFRHRRWAGCRGGAYIVGNTDHVSDDGEISELFERFPKLDEPEPYESAPEFLPRTLVERRDTNQSHLRMSYPLGYDITDAKSRAAARICGIILGGSPSSRLNDEIREQRGLCYSISAGIRAFADVATLNLAAGLASANCVEAYTRMREIIGELHAHGPTEGEVSRARAFVAGRGVLAFENTYRVADNAAHQGIVHRGDLDPDALIADLDAVTIDEVRDIASAIDPDKLSIACLGSHDADEF